MAAADDIFNLLGNWFFISQYLRTSMTLPKLLNEARLEWVLKDTQDALDSSTSQTTYWDLSRLHEELELTGSYLSEDSQM